MGSGWWRRLAASLLLAAAAACGGPAKEAGAPPPAGEWRTFEGTWSVQGRRETVRLGPGRDASIFSLEGNLLVTGERILGQGFRSRTVGYLDTVKGNESWSVWTDTRGDQVFSELHGEPLGTRRRAEGTILGGTGRYAGIRGDYTLEWEYALADPDAGEGALQGRTVTLRGRFRKEGAPAAPGGRP